MKLKVVLTLVVLPLILSLVHNVKLAQASQDAPAKSCQELEKEASSFHKAARELSDYRFAHWNELTEEQRNALELLFWDTLNYASEVNARAVICKVSNS